MTQWLSPVPECDDWDSPIADVFIDGRTKMGPYAIMTPASHKAYGVGLGLGKGQKYKKQPSGKWEKIEG